MDTAMDILIMDTDGAIQVMDGVTLGTAGVIQVMATLDMATPLLTLTTTAEEALPMRGHTTTAAIVETTILEIIPIAEITAIVEITATTETVPIAEIVIA